MYAFYYSSQDYVDPYKGLANSIVGFSLVVYPVISLIYSLIFGDAESVRQTLLSKYRELLQGPFFLLLSNLILVLLISVLGFILLWSRVVTVVSNQDGQLFLNDNPGSVNYLVKLSRGEPQRLRLPVGYHDLVLKDIVTDRILVAKDTNISVPWNDCECEILRFIQVEEKFKPVSSP